jgi:hypothetical protein
MSDYTKAPVIKKELFYGTFVNSQPVSPLDRYKYRPEELTVFQLTLDKEKGGCDLFTLAERSTAN